MKISINRAAFNREGHFAVFTVEDMGRVLGDHEVVQIVDEAGVPVAELVYTPENPTKTGARAYLQVYDETKVRIR
jgi:hypothetical protein